MHTQAGQTRAREQVVTSLRLMAQLAQQENPISQFSSLASTVRVCGGNLFSTQTYQNDYGERQLLAVLAEVTDGLFHDKLEASEVLGLQVDESTDCSDSSNILMFVHFEVSLVAASKGPHFVRCFSCIPLAPPLLGARRSQAVRSCVVRGSGI